MSKYVDMSKRDDSKTTTLPSRGHRLKLRLYEDINTYIDKEELDKVLKPFINDNNEELFKREYECIWISSNKEMGNKYEK